MPTDVAQQKSIPGLAWGGFVALAAGFILLMGASPASAADDDADGSRGLLGALTSTATSAVSTLTDTVTATVEPIVDVVIPVVDTATPVVQSVTDTVDAVIVPVVKSTGSGTATLVDAVTDATATIPVVGPAAQDVVTTVRNTLADTSDAATGLLQNTPIGTVTDPVFDLVGDLPLLGDIAENSGARQLADAIIGVVDNAASDVGETIDDITSPIVDPLPETPATPGDETTPELPPASVPTEALTGDAVIPPGTVPVSASASTSARTSLSTSSPNAMHARADVATGSSPPGPTGSSPPAHAPPGAPAPASGSSASGGAAFHDGACLPGTSARALGLSERTPPASGDNLPASPFADADVSPD